MTTTQVEVRTRAEQVTVTFTFHSQDYSLVSFAERFRGLQLLLTLVFLRDRESARTPIPQFTLRRASLSSPVEATIAIVFVTASSAALFGNRLIELARNASALRVDMARDGLLKLKYDQMRKALEGSVGETGDIDIEPAVATLRDLDVVVIVEAPPGVPELAIDMGPEVDSMGPSPSAMEEFDDQLKDRIEEAKEGSRRAGQQVERMRRRQRRGKP